MAVLLPVEERDSKGQTTRINPSRIFIQDKEIRKIVGRHDWALVPNDDYHEVITAQVQNGKIKFFLGTPHTTLSRKAAKELPAENVPPYILKEIERTPFRVMEQKPAVYEVKIATVGDVETTQVSELPRTADGTAVVIEPIAPDVRPRGRAATVQPAV